MKRAAALGLLVTALTASGAPDDVLDPAAERRWGDAIGAARVITLNETLTQRVERSMEGAPTRALETQETTQAEVREEVLAVEGGRPTRLKVSVTSWAFRSGGEPDESLGGRVALIDPLARTWTLERADPPPSGPARRFLDRLAQRLSPGGEVAAIDSAFLPAKASRAGDTWRAARALVPLAPGAPFTEVDLERSEVTARLAAVAPRRTVELAGALRLLSVPGTSDRFTRGGESQVRGVAAWAPGQRPSEGEVELAQELEGVAEGQLPDGTPYRTTVKLTHTLRLASRRP